MVLAVVQVTDWVPTLVEAAGGGNNAVEWEWTLPLDGVSQWPMLSRGEPSGRTELLINIERDHPTTAPPAPGAHGCTGVGQYAYAFQFPQEFVSSSMWTQAHPGTVSLI